MSGFVMLPDAESVAARAGDCFVALAEDAIADRGRFTVALAGGSTPRPLYARLAEPPLVDRVDWARVQLFWGDERSVPASHPESNYCMAERALLDRVPIPSENVHRIQGELEPHEAAARYRLELQRVLGGGGRFDLIILGMGADGHTASLFPDAAALDERERSFVAVYVEKLGSWRLTLTLPAINAARHVLFLVSGKSKAEALSRVRSGEWLPAAMVQPAEGELIWLVDDDAATGAAHG